MASNIARRVEACHFEQGKEKKHGKLKEKSFMVKGNRWVLALGNKVTCICNTGADRQNVRIQGQDGQATRIKQIQNTWLI